jgi:hypothetical protein
MSEPVVLGLVSLVAIATVAVIALLRRRREWARVAEIQHAMEASLSADPALAGLSLTARVRPGWFGQVEVDLEGQVLSLWQRYAASRVVERELVVRQISGVVVDRIRVAWRPHAARRRSA